MARKKKEETFESSYLNDLVSETGNPFATVMTNDTLSKTTEYISTGSLALNGLISSDITKGIANNRTIALAGEESVGKTYICLSVAKEAIEQGYLIIYFDSENSIEEDVLVNRGIDPSKVMHIPVDTVEDVRGQMAKIINAYNKTKDKSRPKLLMVLDSLGNLSTKKEIEDVEKDNDKKDMTRPAIIKSVFRILSRKLAQAKIPFVVTNHVYSSMDGYVQKKVLSGGSGLRYFASTILYLSKSLAKDEDKLKHGVYIRFHSVKNRLAKEERVVKCLLDYTTGLNKYYGLQGERKTDKGQELKNYCEPLLKKNTISGKVWTYKDSEIKESELLNNDIWTEDIIKLARENMEKEMSYGKDVSVVEEEKEE